MNQFTLAEMPLEPNQLSRDSREGAARAWFAESASTERTTVMVVECMVASCGVLFVGRESKVLCIVYSMSYCTVVVIMNDVS